MLSRFFFNDNAACSTDEDFSSSPEFRFPFDDNPFFARFPEFRSGDGEDAIEVARIWAPRFNVSTALNSCGIWSRGSVLPVPVHVLEGTIMAPLPVGWVDIFPLILSFDVGEVMRPSREVRLWKNTKSFIFLVLSHIFQG